MYFPFTGYYTELHSTEPVKALKFGSKLRQWRWFQNKKNTSDQKLEDAVYLWFVRKRIQSKHYYYYMVIWIFTGYHLQTIS